MMGLLRSRLLGAGVFLNAVMGFRVVHMMGRYGGGKTALGHMIAHELIMSGAMRYLVSNVPSVWREQLAHVRPVDEDSIALDAVVLLDEGGMFLKTRSDVDAYLAFLRKLNLVVLVPSVEEPPRSLRTLRVQRVLDMTGLGLPVWVYRWGIYAGEVKDTGRFYWLWPSAIFGVYSTDAMPVSGSGLDRWLYDWTERARRALDAEYNSDAFVYSPSPGGSQSGMGGVPQISPWRAGGSGAPVDVLGRGALASVDALADRLDELAEEIVSLRGEKKRRRRWRR